MTHVRDLRTQTRDFRRLHTIRRGRPQRRQWGCMRSSVYPYVLMLTISVAVVAIYLWFSAMPQGGYTHQVDRANVEQQAFTEDAPWGIHEELSESKAPQTYLELQHRHHFPVTLRELRGVQGKDTSPSLLTEGGIDTVHYDGSQGRGSWSEEDANSLDTLTIVFPTWQRARQARETLNHLLGFGPRVAGTNTPGRNDLLEWLIQEGLGRRRYRPSHIGAGKDAQPRGRYTNAPHLSARAIGLLEGHSSVNADEMRRAREGTATTGWWWSLSWDNFTETIPVNLPGSTSKEAEFKNFIFHFRGGRQFRRKREGYLPRWKGKGASHVHSPGTNEFTSQEPSATSSTRGISRQPLEHVVLSVHWDSKMESYPFLGACDSAVPMVYLLRTIKNIAALSDVAEALTLLYKSEGALVVPGIDVLFRNHSEADVRAHLSEILTPEFDALFFEYFFQNLMGDQHTRRETKMRASARVETAPDAGARLHERIEDVRGWLDWVQHLPELSLIFFDGEEAFVRWQGTDNTYGSRHLAHKWRNTEWTGGRQALDHHERLSLFQSIDLFVLYDLMGTRGTRFLNYFPAQSGTAFAELAQLEHQARQRALQMEVKLTHDILTTAGLLNTQHDRNGQTHKDRLQALNVIGGPSALRTLIKLAVEDVSLTSYRSLPRLWQKYGSPYDMYTLHGVANTAASTATNYHTKRTYHRNNEFIKECVNSKRISDIHTIFQKTNENIFFPLDESKLRTAARSTPQISDDHIHWLDSKRVLHLIPYPFPASWHTPNDNGSNIDDGTMEDLGTILWHFTLRLGEYWESVYMNSR